MVQLTKGSIPLSIRTLRQKIGRGSNLESPPKPPFVPLPSDKNALRQTAAPKSHPRSVLPIAIVRPASHPHHLRPQTPSPGSSAEPNSHADTSPPVANPPAGSAETPPAIPGPPKNPPPPRHISAAVRPQTPHRP